MPCRVDCGRDVRRCPPRCLSAVIDAGYELWPTEVFVDDTPDPRNDVHYDLVVAAGPGLIDPDLVAGDRAARRAARQALAPRFEHVLAVLGDAIELP